MNQFKYKIFTLLPPHAAIDSMPDWQGEDYPAFEITDDLQECLAQPYRVAAVPALFNQTGSYAYNNDLCLIDWTKFDLVILSDIENSTTDVILEHIHKVNIQNYLVALGGLTDPITDANFVYRPWWIFQHMRLNSFRPSTTKKQFLFEALLGACRIHRSYVMSRFNLNQSILQKSVITYRKEFGSDQHNPEIFLDKEAADVVNNNLIWPYISPNLDPAWEVANEIRRDISEITPWNIYDRTYYSICCETIFQHSSPSRYHDPGPFFITEKTAKVLLGQRLFIMFGPQHTLKFLKELGFKTFDNVIDESYDNCTDASSRFKMAFDQAEYLSTLDPETVMQQTEQIRLHNYTHLYHYRKQIKNKMHQMILDKIPEQFKFA